MNAEPPPNNKYLCEAREPGKATFEFATPDGEAARAMCDAHGWEMIRVYQPGGDADRPADAPAKGDPMLSRSQIKALAIEAGKAFRLLDEMDLADGMAEDDWRRAQVKATVGRKGLSSCQNSHFAKLKRHFRRLQGDKMMASLGGPQSGEGGDTLERREQIVKLLALELGSHARRVTNPQTQAEWTLSEHATQKGGAIGAAYLLTLARGKNPGCTIADVGALITLSSAKLEHLHHTLRNRIAAREGRGKTAKRNRKQGGN